MTLLQYFGAYLFTVLILWAVIKVSPEAKVEEEVLARYPALQKAVDVSLYIYLAPLFLAHLVRQRIRPRRAFEKRSRIDEEEFDGGLSEKMMMARDDQ